jgi:hypothetical protein
MYIAPGMIIKNSAAPTALNKRGDFPLLPGDAAEVAKLYAANARATEAAKKFTVGGAAAGGAQAAINKPQLPASVLASINAARGKLGKPLRTS